jgi:hypothetical protein
LRVASQDGSLTANRNLLSLLYRWREFADDGGEEVRRWTVEALDSDELVARLAAAATSTRWSQGMGFDGLGDRVAQGTDHAEIVGLDSILEVERLRLRLEALEVDDALSQSNQHAVVRFLSAWRREERGETD